MQQFLVDVFCTRDDIQRCRKHRDLSEELANMPQEAYLRLFLKMQAIEGLSEEEKERRLDAYKI